ncbi:MAG TPA: S41 family peptidase [Desulfuromonadaceae bacterium]
MKKPLLIKTQIIVLAAIAICLAIILMSHCNKEEAISEQTYLQLLKEAHAAVIKYYVDPPDPKKLMKGMVDGVLASLDPHSAYLPPEPYKEMEEQISGAFGGIGIELGMKEDRLTVIAPIEDTPAFRAGIQPNDHIFKINATFTRGMNISKAVSRMRGEKGTPVTLTVLREKVDHPLTFKLIRDVIKIKSLKTRILEPGYGLIRISQFQEHTGSDFKKALKELRAAAGGTFKGLVIDLRFNPGGLLVSAVEVANCFIGHDPANSLIVSTKGRLPDSNQMIRATVGEKEPRYPIVVLINAGSASASEIVAGALQDHKRAVIMGQQSFGKGSVQSIFPLPGNAALKLTTARYYTPSGRSIQAKGITPDVLVAGYKPIEKTAGQAENIREQDLERSLAPDGKKDAVRLPHSGLVDPDSKKDYQLTRALELLRSLDLVREQRLVR